MRFGGIKIDMETSYVAGDEVECGLGLLLDFDAEIECGL